LSLGSKGTGAKERRLPGRAPEKKRGGTKKSTCKKDPQAKKVKNQNRNPTFVAGRGRVGEGGGGEVNLLQCARFVKKKNVLRWKLGRCHLPGRNLQAPETKVRRKKKETVRGKKNSDHEGV